MTDASLETFENFAKKFSVPEPNGSVDRTIPAYKNHEKLLDHFKKRIRSSEEQMCTFYTRWRNAELLSMAFAETKVSKDKRARHCRGEGKKRKVKDVGLPFIFASLETVCTYMLQTFAGRKPMLQLGAYDPVNLKRARLMEKKLQYDADHNKLIDKFYNWFWDAFLYGVGIQHIEWKVERGVKFDVTESGQRTKDPLAIIYEGNEFTNIDPYLFYPDPSVPMKDVAEKGDFVAWRQFKTHNWVIKQGLIGNLEHTDKISMDFVNHNNYVDNLDFRTRVSGYSSTTSDYRKDVVQIDTGTFEIIPKQYGLKPMKDGYQFNPDMPAKWLLIVLNKSVIAYAAPYLHDHGMHPVSVIEPYSDGHSFGSVGLADILEDTQETGTFLLDSHISSLRQSINQKILVDPTAVNVGDLKSQDSGAIVRLREGSFGRDINQVLADFTPNDPTIGNVQSLQSIMRIGDMLSGTNDNLRGQQRTGGRKTATEVRSSNESSTNRLAAKGMRISSQGISNLKRIGTINNMQFLSEDFELVLHGREAVLESLGQKPTTAQLSPVDGQDEVNKTVRIGANDLIGDFYYPIHDGTLPMDKVAIVQLWTQLLQQIQQDPELRQVYDLPRLFDRVALLAGVENVEEFRRDIIRQPAGGDPAAGAPNVGPPGQQPGNPQPAGSPSASVVPITGASAEGPV